MFLLLCIIFHIFYMFFFSSFLPSFLSFLLFKPIPEAYGSCQARGQIGVTAASLRHSHSNVGSELSLQPTPQLRQCWIPDPLSKPGVEPASSWILVGFVSSAPQWHSIFFFFIPVCCSKANIKKMNKVN